MILMYFENSRYWLLLKRGGFMVWSGGYGLSPKPKP